MHRAVVAKSAAPRARATSYPEPFAARIRGRVKCPLGELFGLRNFGVNLTTLAPGGSSALFHCHSRQDEFVYILEGDLVLVTDDGEQRLHPGMCFGFPAGGTAHHLINRSAQEAVYLEIGDRSDGDEVSYPNDDIRAVLRADGTWLYAHKDGTPY
jgi:uncharacterized cupin superfamily protein